MAISANGLARVLTNAGVGLFIAWTQVTFAPGAIQWVCLAIALAPVIFGMVLGSRVQSGR